MPALIDGDVVCMPALWREHKDLVVYSRTGCGTQIWDVPPEWSEVKKAIVYKLSIDGLAEIKTVEIIEGRFRLAVGEQDAFVVKPCIPL